MRNSLLSKSQYTAQSQGEDMRKPPRILPPPLSLSTKIFQSGLKVCIHVREGCSDWLLAGVLAGDCEVPIGCRQIQHLASHLDSELTKDLKR